jgi:hypothetical protein
MELHEPFIIGPRLLPALRIGDALLSLESVALANCRSRAVFVLDIGEQSCHLSDVASGMQGFRSVVEPFETMLSYMGACAEAISYTKRTGQASDNGSMFSPFVAQWCADNESAISMLAHELQDENGDTRHELIEE